MKRLAVTSIAVLFCLLSHGQQNALFQNLPVGPNNVGFTIVTLTDSSRVDKPQVNYFGEQEKKDRYHKITIHIWYPALKRANEQHMTIRDYCVTEGQKVFSVHPSTEEQQRYAKNVQESISHFFGTMDQKKWEAALATKMIAVGNAPRAQKKFSLLVGMLRSFSTTVTNELLASNGYVVAMVANDGGRWPLAFIENVADMQQAMRYATTQFSVDPEHVGSFGFSGSGFSQLLLAMNDPRIAAYADIESALYGDGVAEILNQSDYYDPKKLHVPFLHIYGKELGSSDVKFDDFLNTKYSNRYHLVLNAPGLHHWDVATEGRISNSLLHMRGPNEAALLASFEICNQYLLHFFNAHLKNLEASEKFLADRKIPGGYADSLWTITAYKAQQIPPDKEQFIEYIKRKGFDAAIQLARDFFSRDSNTAFTDQNELNGIAHDLVDDGNLKDGIRMMKLATEFHPLEAWLWNNLGSMQEDAGEKQDAIISSKKATELLKDFTGPPSSFDGRIRNSALDRLKRLAN